MAGSGCEVCGSVPDSRERFEFRAWGEKSWRRFWLCLPCYQKLSSESARLAHERDIAHLAHYFGIEKGEKR